MFVQSNRALYTVSSKKKNTVYNVVDRSRFEKSRVKWLLESY